MKTLKALGVAALVAASATSASAQFFNGYSDDDARSGLNSVQSAQQDVTRNYTDTNSLAASGNAVVDYSDDDARSGLNGTNAYVLPEAK
ncbi:hypothetical protein PSM7751_03602 [Pseudooceanicola marinus]|uniref:Uncharacterized protein n=1 Tax=Pseudooceanicola marinus TaxID=396013 RepID=A0A1X7A2Q6_9RHOB|nr:hypothetical protein [Pseudooceanicola marinus]PJE31214.1 hypothetical protein CVM50_08585 [Pseudooceanicola marinus]SLN68613.1 hypothetical protein PSM7751_03602 [Pseudooceanicola marinus]